MTRFATTLGAAVLVLGASLSAADLSVKSAGAVEGGLMRIAGPYTQATGNTPRIVYNTGPELTRWLTTGEPADVLIAPAAVVDQAVKDGRADAATRLVLGKVGVGVVVRSGAPRPDISTADTLKQALLKADSIVYGQGTIGLYVEKMLGEMGLADAVKAKGRRGLTGRDVAQLVVDGRGNDIGLSAISEIKLLEDRGAVLVGPVPGALQNYTAYAGVALTNAKAPDTARDFLRVLASPASAAAFRASGLE